MAIAYMECKILNRQNVKSAVRAAAYRAGEKLKDEMANKTYNYSNKKEVIYNEIDLPENAPKTFYNRSTLWTSVEKVEKQKNAQLCREFQIALPKECTHGQMIECSRQFVKENFVSKGMCADWAIHDKKDGNPHLHIMTTMRALDEKGNWLPKQRKIYDLDSDGNRIPLLNKSGRQRKEKNGKRLWKCHTEKTVDWDDPKNMERWRSGWQKICNKYLDKDNQIDMRSYKRQKSEIIPQMHLGPKLWAVEKKGIRTARGIHNRYVQLANSHKRGLRKIQILKAQRELLAVQIENYEEEQINAALMAANNVHNQVEKEMMINYGQSEGNGNGKSITTGSRGQQEINRGQQEISRTTQRRAEEKRRSERTNRPDQKSTSRSIQHKKRKPENDGYGGGMEI